MSQYDLGTTRMYESEGYLEVFCRRGDEAMRVAVKSYRPRWDPVRKSWKINLDPRWNKFTVGEIVEALKEAALSAAPEGWRGALPKLQQITSVTRWYKLRIGEGGVRIGLPRGHRFEYTFKKIDGVEKDGETWTFPASICNSPRVTEVIKDVVKDDRDFLFKLVDYLDGFVMSGDLNLAEGDVEALGLKVGALVAADPSFVRRIYPDIANEPVSYYVFRLLSLEPNGDFFAAKLAFVTGDDCYKHLRRRLAPGLPELSLPLDMRHAEGKWVRRRAA